MDVDWDVVVVGRSFAGLSAALTLGRMRRSVLVIGSGGPRNEAVAHAHGLLTRDGADPNELIDAAIADLDKYPTIELVDGHVSSVQEADNGFRVTFDGHRTSASKIILATGVNDDPLPISGLAEHWGRGVYTCPLCDGYEHRDAPLAVVGDPLIAPHLATFLTAVTDRITVYPPVGPDARNQLVTAGIAVDDREVVRVIGDRTQITALELDDRTTVDTAALFMASVPHPNNQLAIDLGCIVDLAGFVEVGPSGRTTIDNVWAAGDLAGRHHQMSVAIAQGATAGVDCAGSLIVDSH